MALGRRETVLLARFSDAFIRKGVVKSFGVLVPAMTVYLGTNYTTIGLILSLNAALMQLACTLMNPLMKHISTQVVATTGGLISGVCILCIAFTHSVYVTGFLFVTAGFLSASCNLGTATMLHQHYRGRFGAMNSVGLMGLSVGSTLLPLLTAELYRRYGFSGTTLILGGLLLNEFPIGAVLVPPIRRTGTKKVKPENEDGLHTIPRSQDKETGYTEDREDFVVGSTHGKCRKENGTVDPLEDCQADSVASSDQEHISHRASCCVGCMNFLKDTFDFQIFRNEKHFTFIMMPILITTALPNYSWVLFVTSYAISVGIDPFQAAYLAAVGAAGGITCCALQAIVFHKRPQWSPHVMAILFLSGALMLILQTLYSSLPYLLMCSFIIGASLYGSSTVVDAVIAVIVAPQNFQGAMAFSLALEGIGTLIAGPFSGFLFDSTGSFKTVFIVLGGITGLGHLLCLILIFTRRRKRHRYNAVKGFDEKGEDLQVHNTEVQCS